MTLRETRSAFAGLAFVILGFCLTAQADDGFYEGSGYSLIPVHNTHLSVTTATITIEPNDADRCYLILLDGQSMPREFGSKRPFKTSELGAAVSCRGTDQRSFHPPWKATVVYDVAASADQSGVQLGFPVPSWQLEYSTEDGLDGTGVDGVANFHIWMNDIPVTGIRKSVLPPIPNELVAHGKPEKMTGYLWKSSFKKGKHTTLRTVYEFGVMHNAEFFAAQSSTESLASDNGHYQDVIPYEGKVWFLERLKTKTTTDLYVRSASIDYVLTPIKLWGPPVPQAMHIVVNSGPDLATPFLVPLYPTPSCVDLHQLVFDFKNQLPERELRVSYPEKGELGVNIPPAPTNLAPMTTLKDWMLWQASFGSPKPQFTCSLIDYLKQAAEPPLRTQLNSTVCVSRCNQGS